MVVRLTLLVAVLVIGSAQAIAPDIEWSVVNPFRFYKQEKGFQIHRDVFEAIVPDSGRGHIPSDIVLQVEFRLNMPSCDYSYDFDACAKNPKPGARKDDRLGWANRNIGNSRNNAPQISGPDEQPRVLEFEYEGMLWLAFRRLRLFPTMSPRIWRREQGAVRGLHQAGISCGPHASFQGKTSPSEGPFLHLDFHTRGQRTTGTTERMR